MMKRISQFTKFILKKIVRGVAIGDSSDHMSGSIYKFIKVELNDNIIREIMEEGTRYNLSYDQCIAEIRMADEMVNSNPSTDRITTAVRITDFELGERLDLVYHNNIVGRVVLSVIVDEHGHFIVLKSDISDVEYRDVLIPLHRRFNCGYPSFFDVYRGECLLTGDDYQFSPGRLEYIERYRQGLVFDILDADETFAYSASVDKPDKTQKE